MLQPRLILITLFLILFLLFGMIVVCQLEDNRQYAPVEAPQALPFAVLVQTNLVRQNCPCGFCDPSRGIVVPEHINQIGFDLAVQVSTNYLPIISK